MPQPVPHCGFCTAHSRKSLQWAPLSSKIAHSHGDLDPHLIHDSLGPSDPINQTASLSVHPFLHRWPHSDFTYFTMGRPFTPSKLPFRWGIWTPIFPGPTRVLNPNSISIGSAVLARLTSVTDRQTDHATRSVTIDRIYVRSTAMRSNNASVVMVTTYHVTDERALLSNSQIMHTGTYIITVLFTYLCLVRRSLPEMSQVKSITVNFFFYFIFVADDLHSLCVSLFRYFFTFFHCNTSKYILFTFLLVSAAFFVLTCH